MVLANPHFPWQGSERFYQSHLVIPGKMNVSGASLFGVPVIMIGHTENLAWTHTVSTAFRFVPIQLKLVPGDPTSYLVDGQPEKMESNDVTVQTLQPDGSLAPVTRTLYTTRYGPVFNTLQGQPFFDWTPTTAYAMYDANADNLRLPQPLLRDQQRPVDPGAARDPEEVRGHPVGEHDGRRLARQGALRRHRLDPERPQREGDRRLPGAARRAHLPGPRAADPRRLALGCAPGTDPDSVVPGIFGPSSMPFMFRRDYVANSNDSYWLTNPAQPLEGFARIIGDERTPRSLRTRLGLMMLEQRLAGTDGYAGDKFNLNKLRRIEFNDRLYGAELFRATLAEFCHANPSSSTPTAPRSTSATPARRSTASTRSRTSTAPARSSSAASCRDLGAPPFTTPFDVTDPVNTPSGLDTSDPAVGTALADAVTDLSDAGIPFDAPLGHTSTSRAGAENIPIHGGPDGQGAFNVITDRWKPPAGYPDVTDGSSFIMVAGFDKDGKVRARPHDPHLLGVGEPELEALRRPDPACSRRRSGSTRRSAAGQVEHAAKSTKVIRGG